MRFINTSKLGTLSDKIICRQRTMLVKGQIPKTLNFIKLKGEKLLRSDTRQHKITFRMNDKEYEIFEHKFMLSKSNSKGEFIRKMILNGIVLHFDEKKAKSAFKYRK